MTEPIQTVSADPTTTQLATGARDIGLVIAAVVALAGLVSKHDWNGIIAYIQSAPAITALGVIAAVAIPVWRQFSARWSRKLLVQAATSPANTVVNVKE